MHLMVYNVLQLCMCSVNQWCTGSLLSTLCVCVVPGVKMDPCGGVLHARASQVVRVTARPVKTAPYSCAISCRLISTNPGRYTHATLSTLRSTDP